MTEVVMCTACGVPYREDCNARKNAIDMNEKVPCSPVSLQKWEEMSRVNLFTRGSFTSHAGHILHWKINCDALTEADWECLAVIALKMMSSHRFPGVHLPSEIVGIPTGGLKFADAINKKAGWSYPEPTFRLWVDDVYTTGKSFSKVMDRPTDMGLAVFARGRIPPRSMVQAIFKMPYEGL